MVTPAINAINAKTLAIGAWLARQVASWSTLIGLAIMTALTVTIAAVGYFVPINNWDMFAYLASAHQANGVTDPAALHAYAYETVRQNVPAGDWIVLTQDREYRIRQFEDADAFYTMLGFYKVKLLYVQALAFLSHYMDGYQAIRVLCVVPTVLIGALATLWLGRERALHLAPLAVALFLAAMFGDIAREGTPDALAAFLFVAGIWAFIAKREAWVAVLLFLGFLARPDHIAYTGVLMFVAFMLRAPSWGATVAFFVSLAAYVPLTKMGGHPGWWIHFYFTNVEFVPTLAGFDPDFSIVTYLKSQMRVVVRSLVEETWLVVMIIGVFGWWQLVLRGFVFAKRETVILLATVLAMGAKMVIFPLNETRFWFP